MRILSMAFSLSLFLWCNYMTPSYPVSDMSLVELLKERIALSGPISFSEFMGCCLYDPMFGYYMTNRQRIGRTGDFFTSSSVHAIFGKLIAKQLAQMWNILGCPNDFIIAEQGAGEGHLCLDILDALQSNFPAFYSVLHYHIVEMSPVCKGRQAKELSRHQQRVRWSHRAELSGMVGCFLSNELIDAFPVHLVEKRNSKLCEVFVAVKDNKFQEVLGDLSTIELSNYLEWIGAEILEGNRAEINLAAPLWMRDVAGLLARGFILTIDYGYQARELYAPWRTCGTLMCYYQHTTSENPYIRIGEQDITSHVDFSALMKSGEEAGLQNIFYGEQCKFLLGLGFIDALMEAEAKEGEPHRAQALRLTLKNLILPESGMGEIFKVLIQCKGVSPQSQNLLCTRPLSDISLPAGNFF